MRWIEIKADFIMDKTVQAVEVVGKKLCLIKFKEEYFATDAKCPHAGADISQGCCKNGFLICPFHRYEYNLKDGRGKAGQGDYLKTYPVKTENDKIYVGFEEVWWKKLFH